MASNGTTSRKVPSYNYLTHPSLTETYPAVTCITQEIFDAAVNLRAEHDDTFVTSYPKNGTTWLMNILFLMRNNGVPLSKGDQMDDHFPFLEFAGGPERAEKLARPRLIKTHLYWNLTPYHEEAKYVFVARNPKDVVVSFYYHTVGFKDLYHFKDGSFDDYFEVFMSGRCDSGDYFELVPQWIQESRKRDNVYFMLYEDMKYDIKGEILKLAEFLGESWREPLLLNNEELLNKVIELSSFKKMQKDVNIFCQEDRPDHIPFVRKGITGDWKNHLSREQSDRIDAKLAEVSRRYPGFDKLWSRYDRLLTF